MTAHRKFDDHDGFPDDGLLPSGKSSHNLCALPNTNLSPNCVAEDCGHNRAPGKSKLTPAKAGSRCACELRLFATGFSAASGSAAAHSPANPTAAPRPAVETPSRASPRRPVHVAARLHSRSPAAAVVARALRASSPFPVFLSSVASVASVAHKRSPSHGISALRHCGADTCGHPAMSLTPPGRVAALFPCFAVPASQGAPARNAGFRAIVRGEDHHHFTIPFDVAQASTSAITRPASISTIAAVAPISFQVQFMFVVSVVCVLGVASCRQWNRYRVRRRLRRAQELALLSRPTRRTTCAEFFRSSRRCIRPARANGLSAQPARRPGRSITGLRVAICRAVTLRSGSSPPCGLSTRPAAKSFSSSSLILVPRHSRAEGIPCFGLTHFHLSQTHPRRDQPAETSRAACADRLPDHGAQEIPSRHSDAVAARHDRGLVSAGARRFRRSPQPVHLHHRRRPLSHRSDHGQPTIVRIPAPRGLSGAREWQ